MMGSVNAESKLSAIIKKRSRKVLDHFKENPNSSLEIVIQFWEGILDAPTVCFLEARGFKGFGIKFYSHLKFRGVVNWAQLIEILEWFEMPDRYETEQFIVSVDKFDIVKHIVES